MIPLSKLVLMSNQIAIAGAPGTGKTYLAKSLSELLHIPIAHTDDHMQLPWSEQPEAVLHALRGQDRFIVEGLQVPRIIRKGLETDLVLWLSEAMEPQTKKQIQAGNGAYTILEESGCHFYTASSIDVENLLAEIKEAIV